MASFDTLRKQRPSKGPWTADARRAVRKFLLGAVLLTTTSLGLLLLFRRHYDPWRMFSGEQNGRISRSKETSEFYQWHTTTSYDLVSNSTELTQDELCRHFPKYQLFDIQPVLKTGHGVIDRVRQSLKSTSACLENLLIFSDLDEAIEGHQVIDIIADIPEKLLRSTTQTEPYFALQEAGLDDAAAKPSDGWRTDKFKFLTAISRAWKMAPEKRWYVFYEGDTYVVWDTVFRLLENFDPDLDHYFGSPSPGREGTWFANGGPGYILSRGAMRKLVCDDWDHTTGDWLGSKLVEKWWDLLLEDCCGDSVLGWALHQRGVDLKGLWPMFNPHPLHGVPFADRYWCQPVLSMHKSDQEEEVDFWTWEWEQRQAKRPLLWRDIALSYHTLDNLTHRENWDNAAWDAYPPAEDDPHQPHESAEACEVACNKAVGSGCFQWTYHLHRCQFVRSIRLGRARDPGVDDVDKDREWPLEDQRYVAGWNVDNISRWISERPCDEVQWVTPSIERIF